MWRLNPKDKYIVILLSKLGSIHVYSILVGGVRLLTAPVSDKQSPWEICNLSHAIPCHGSTAAWPRPPKGKKNGHLGTKRLQSKKWCRRQLCFVRWILFRELEFHSQSHTYHGHCPYWDLLKVYPLPMSWVDCIKQQSSITWIVLSFTWKLLLAVTKE